MSQPQEIAPPDHRRWTSVTSFDAGRSHLNPEDIVAVRWWDGWRIAERWRTESGGKSIVCVFADGGTIEVPSPSMILRHTPTGGR